MSGADFTETLVADLAHHLGTVTGVLWWMGDGPTPAGRVPIRAWSLPVEIDRAVALSVYPVNGDTGHTTATVGVQFRIRGGAEDPRTVLAVTDALVEALDNRTSWDLGAVPIVRSWEQSGADLGVDDNRRPHATRNYYFTLTRETRHRRD